MIKLPVPLNQLKYFNIVLKLQCIDLFVFLHGIVIDINRDGSEQSSVISANSVKRAERQLDANISHLSDSSVGHQSDSRSSVTLSKPKRKSNSSKGTTVTYTFCSEAVPYRISVPGKDITLGQFKAALSKKGDFR